MSRLAWRWLRLLTGAAMLALLVWRLGTGPVVDGLHAVSAGPVAAAVGITAVTTVFSAWRWSLVARGLGIATALPKAVAAYYRSQFLNTTLPGGVLGDVHRAVDHGREVGDVGRGLRAVWWERAAGQSVQVVIAVAVLLVLPSPVRPFVLVATPVTVVGALVTLLVLRARRRGARRTEAADRGRWSRTLRTAAEDVRGGLLARKAWPGVLLASVVVVAGHTAVFLIAARAAGSTASTAHLLPLVMLVLLAMSVPTSIAGWGPREGVAAWVFDAAGLGAGPGLAAATVCGILVLVAALPGAAVLAAGWRPGSLPRPRSLARG
jgi:glycosyltransferase 2 family protein